MNEQFYYCKKLDISIRVKDGNVTVIEPKQAGHTRHLAGNANAYGVKTIGKCAAWYIEAIKQTYERENGSIYESRKKLLIEAVL